MVPSGGGHGLPLAPSACSPAVRAGFRRDRVQEAKAPAPDDGIEELIYVLDA